MLLTKFPRVNLAHLSTPLEEMPRLTEVLGGPKLYIKRDDCTGLATGGNKTRKLEFLVADAIAQGCDMLVTQGAVQSNHVRQTAAAAAKLGLKCHALLERRVPDRQERYEQTGNVLLDHILGCSIEYRPAGLDMNQEAIMVAENLKKQGHNPYFIPGGGSNEIGALGYANCAFELTQQLNEAGIDANWLMIATGSTGTHAGLLAGFNAVNSQMKVMGSSVRQPKLKQIDAVYGLTERTNAKLGLSKNSVSKDDVLVVDDYVGEGYGMPTEKSMEAIKLFAQYEGIFLDPVYSAKGAAGLIGLIRNGHFTKDDTVVFLHTGGSVALFAYENELMQSV